MKNTILRIEGIKKKFGSIEALKGIDLEVKKGEVIVILGPSGCGKSTLLRCINGLEKYDEGKIILNEIGELGTDLKWEKVREKIGMVFQSYELFSHMSVMDNILLGPTKVQKRNKEEVIEQANILLKKVGLLERKDAYPRELSGGQKQRIAIVRSLCMNPEIILFDEVTAALDPEMVREVLDVMKDLAKGGMTMIVVTHEMSFARSVGDKIVFMDNGKVCEITKPEEFFTNPQTQRARNFLNILEYK